jgi:hypothetical protein
MTTTSRRKWTAVCALALLAVAVLLLFRGCEAAVTTGGPARTVLIAGGAVEQISPGVLEFTNQHDGDLSITARAGMHDRPVNQDRGKGASPTLDFTASGTRGER